MSKNLASIIEPHRHLSKIAIVDRGQSFSYEQVNDRACAIANGLRLNNIQPGQSVALRMSNGIEFVTSYFGILRAGCVAVLINFRLPASVIEYILNDSMPALVIDADNYNSLLVDGPDQMAEVEETDPAVILYTSGTTSMPKGVVIPHKHKWAIDIRMVNRFLSIRRTLVGAPCYHANGLTNMEVGLAGQSTLCLIQKFDGASVINAINTMRVSSINTVPSVMAMAVKELEAGASATGTEIVRNITMASAPLSQKLVTDIKRLFPNVYIANSYGITEVGPGLFIRPDGKVAPDGSVGYVTPGIDYRLVDGVLQVRSPSMMLHYNNQPNPNLTEDGYYNTNDLFEVDSDGAYFFIGRADDMFTNGGNNVYPLAVEQTLERHPSIKEAAVIGLDDELKGQRPYAFVVATDDFDEQAIIEYMFASTAATNCPKRIWKLENFPLNSVNKIDKKQLKIWAQERL